MLRRELISLLLGGAAARLIEGVPGVALLAGVREWKLMAASEPRLAGTLLAPPGSALKPIVLRALLRSGKLDPAESFACPGRLRIRNRNLDCSHPPLPEPMRVETALAYSCNCFAAHVAERFAAGELARELERAGLASPSRLLGDAEAAGRIARAPDQRLQALGEDSVLITAAALAAAYRGLALNPEPAIVAGLEGAVEYGTAQRAAVPGVKVAGKTGSVLAETGQRMAWFAGFMPSLEPRVVVVVMLRGRSGGADAAPVAGRILADWREGRL
jgi:cell division protein FtsI/penicillin-binding protein 2